MKLASVVMPSLDAATDKVFIKINRPHSRLSVERMIEGLIQLRKKFQGLIWLEIFIIPGLNNTEPELTALKCAIQKISPDRVQLNTQDRPGPVSNIRAATPEELKQIIQFWDLDNIEIIAKASDRKTMVAYRKDVESAILETVARRPCTLEDLTNILGLHANEVNKYLDVLEADKKVSVTHQARGQFYQICPE